MAGDDGMRFEEVERNQGIIRTHGEVVTYTDDSQIKIVAADKRHIREQGSVARNVDLLAIEREQETGRISAVASIWQTRAVVGHRKFHMAKRMLEAAAQMLRMGIFHPLVPQPTNNLKVGNDHGAGPFGNADRITHMVTMTVCEQNVIRIHIFGP